MKALRNCLAVSLSFALPVQSLAALPLSSPASPFSISIPSSIGFVSETHSTSATDHPDVIFVQDLHVNRSVQFAISRILKELKMQGLLPDRIAVEGDTGPVDIKSMQEFPDVRIRKETADYIVRQGEMPGAMHFAVTEGEGGLYGVEKDEYYMANIEMYRRSYEGRQALRRTLVGIEKAIPQLKVSAQSSEKVAQLEKDVRAVRQLIDTQVVASELPATLRQVVQAVEHFKTILPADNAKTVVEPLSASVNFYGLALLRNEELFNNAIALRNLDHQKTMVLVTGGFHTEAMANLCKAKGLSYAVITPRVRRHNKIDERLYIARLLGQHLTPEQAATGQDWSAMQMVLPLFRGITNRLFVSRASRSGSVARLAGLGTIAAMALCGQTACTNQSLPDFEKSTPAQIYQWAVDNRFPTPVDSIRGGKVSRYLLPHREDGQPEMYMAMEEAGPDSFSYGLDVGDLSHYPAVEVTIIPSNQMLDVASVDMVLDRPGKPKKTLHFHGLEMVKPKGAPRHLRVTIPKADFMDADGQQYSGLKVVLGKINEDESLNPDNVPSGVIIRGYRGETSQGALHIPGVRVLPVPNADPSGIASVVGSIARLFEPTLLAQPYLMPVQGPYFTISNRLDNRHTIRSKDQNRVVIASLPNSDSSPYNLTGSLGFLFRFSTPYVGRTVRVHLEFDNGARSSNVVESVVSRSSELLLLRRAFMKNGITEEDLNSRVSHIVFEIDSPVADTRYVVQAIEGLGLPVGVANPDEFVRGLNRRVEEGAKGVIVQTSKGMMLAEDAPASGNDSSRAEAKLVQEMYRVQQTIHASSTKSSGGVFEQEGTVSESALYRADSISINVRARQAPSRLQRFAVHLRDVENPSRVARFWAERSASGQWQLRVGMPQSETDQVIFQSIESALNSQRNGIDIGATISIKRERISREFPKGFRITVETGTVDPQNASTPLNTQVIPSEMTVDILVQDRQAQDGSNDRNRVRDDRTEPNGPVKMGTPIDEIPELNRVTVLDRAQRAIRGTSGRAMASLVGVTTVILGIVGLGVSNASAAGVAPTITTGPLAQQISGTLHAGFAAQAAQSGVAAFFRMLTAWAQNNLSIEALTNHLHNVLQSVDFNVHTMDPQAALVSLLAAVGATSAYAYREEIRRAAAHAMASAA